MKYYEAQNQQGKKYKIKEIFADYWNEFVKLMASQGKPIRKVIMEEVEKVIGCQEPENGYSLYLCEHFQRIKYVPYTCKSRFCNCCGVKYFNDRALSISSKLIDCSHRHVVFTIPAVLSPYFAHYRSLSS